ncbi:MAG: hypothetical protein MPJ50_05705 [Pirellulales bacterium]|nr:hypothetical protein [Pirellulales bacterium]
MASPADNPFTPTDVPTTVPIEVIEEEERKFDEVSADALAKCWFYAGIAGILLLAVSAAIAVGTYFKLPFPHFLPRLASAATVGGFVGAPAVAALMFATAALRLRTIRDQEQFVLVLARQRRALATTAIAIIACVAILFFLVMLNVHDALRDLW